MNTIREILRDADPLRHESPRLEGERDRLRRAVIVTAAKEQAPSPAWFRSSTPLLATIVLLIVGIAVVGFQVWSRGGVTVQAAIRFEMRLAEDRPDTGLREARIAGANRAVYLHDEIIVTNGDIAQSRVVQGNSPSHFGVSVTFNAAGTRKMHDATSDHLGRPVAILIDGDVIAAPVLKSAIGSAATISGDFTKAEAERIVAGIGIR